MKIKTKLSLFFTGFALLGILVILTVAFYNADSDTINVSRDHLSSIAEIQKSRVEEVISKDLEQLNQIKNRTGIIDDVESYENNSSSTVAESLNTRITDAQNSSKGFNDIAVYDQDGNLITSSNSKVKVEDFYNPSDLKKEIGESKIELSYKGERKLIIHGPIEKNGITLGTLLIISDISDFQKITQDYTGLGTTGETTIAGRTDNGDAIYLSAPRFGSPTTIVSKDATNVAITQALQKKEEIFTNLLDYRGHPVYAVTKYIPEVDWGLVVKKDKTEIFQPIYSNAWTMGGISLAFLIIAFLISIAVANSISRPIVKLQKGTEEIERGNLDYKAALNSKDEIGQLSRSFDAMTASLKESRENIETKISERTTDLEKINKAMIGRELKMIELKKEIEKLKEKK